MPYAENILEIDGIGENILAGILAEMGDISPFDDAKEIRKLSCLGLVSNSSGKHNGETKISHRGRKRLRYWLFQAAKSAVSHAEEFKTLHVYLYNETGQSTEEDAIVDCDSPQNFEGDLRNLNNRPEVRSGKDVERYPAYISCCRTSSINKELSTENHIFQ